MKIKYFINLHKAMTALVILGLMYFYQNYSLAAWVYLALHGTYGLLWLLKDQLFPDKRWEESISVVVAGVGFLMLGLYWVAPFILISQDKIPPLPLVSGAIALYTVGMFLHFVSDAQKYYTLKYQSGLIQEGLFARSRNINYLGEVLIYLSFAMLAMHWLPYVIVGFFFAVVFVPNMLKKDESLARYPEFEGYKQASGLLLPKL